MTDRARTGLVLLMLAQTLAGCGGSNSSSTPSAPSVIMRPPVFPRLAVFTDPASGFATSDVRDVHEQILRFNITTCCPPLESGELIWIDGTRFSRYWVNGNLIQGSGPDDLFQVHFGTKNGERRAYLGWDEDACHCPGSPATVISIEAVSGRLVFTATGIRVPES